MGFWIFMLVMTLLTPIIMIVFGRLFLKNAPGKINYSFGYRSSRSMKNKDTWEFAHKYIGRLWYICGVCLLPITVMIMILFLKKGEDTIGTVGAAVCGIQMMPLVGAIYPTEKALQKAFDKNGHRKYFLRNVTKKDAKILFYWTNDPVTRENSFRTQPVLWEEHINWLDKKIKDKECLFLIMSDGTMNYGTIRIDCREEKNGKKQAVISFSVAPEHRGKGFGVKMLALAEQKVRYWNEEKKFVVEELIGEVKRENTASRKCFENNGYLLDEEMNNEETNNKVINHKVIYDEVIYRKKIKEGM